MAKKKKDDVAESTTETQTEMDPKQQDVMLNASHRESLYEQYDQLNQSPTTEEVVEETPAPPAETEEQAQEVVVPEPVASTETEEAVTPTEPKETRQEEKKEKTVPYQALIQEREKRKAATRDKHDYEDQLKKLQAELEEVRKSKETNIPLVDYLDDPETAFKLSQARLETHEEKLSRMEQELEKNRQFAEEQKNKAIQDQLDEQIKAVDASLTESNMPGFRMFVPQVVDKINQLSAEDSSWEVLRKPDGWKYVYEKYIYPEVKTVFQAKARQQQVEDKKALKRDANLVGSAGEAEHKDKEEEVETPKQYMERRRKQGVM